MTTTSRREVYQALIHSAHQALLAAQALCPQRVVVNQTYIIQELGRTLHSLESGEEEEEEAAATTDPDGENTLPDMPLPDPPTQQQCQIQ